MPALAPKARMCFFYLLTNLLIFIFCYIGAAPVQLTALPPGEQALPPPSPPQEEEPQQEAAFLSPTPLNRPLSSSTEALVLKVPAQVQLTVEYFVGQPYTAELKTPQDISAFTKALQNASLLEEDAQILLATPSNVVAARLGYAEGYGSLYLFSGYINGGKKPVTIIQDSDNRLYQTKQNISQEIFQKARPQVTHIPADKINIYTATHFRRLSLQAQLSSQEDFAPLVQMLNTLTQAGGASQLEKPDFIISYVPTGSAQEEDMWYVWASGKKLTLIPVQNPSAAYTSEVTPREFKKVLEKFSVK